MAVIDMAIVVMWVASVLLMVAARKSRVLFSITGCVVAGLLTPLMLIASGY
jgi:hypothetical protein